MDWTLIAQETAIGSHVTVGDYIETLEALFLLRVVPAVRILGQAAPSFRKRRKVCLFPGPLSLCRDDGLD